VCTDSRRTGERNIRRRGVLEGEKNVARGEKGVKVKCAWYICVGLGMIKGGGVVVGVVLVIILPRKNEERRTFRKKRTEWKGVKSKAPAPQRLHHIRSSVLTFHFEKENVPERNVISYSKGTNGRRKQSGKGKRFSLGIKRKDNELLCS